MRHLFVMTYGRSGSTLLMGILNSIPGFVIRGENQQVLRHLHRFHRDCVAMKTACNPDKAGASTHPWFGITGFDEEASLSGIRALVEDSLLRPGADARVTGFKEIRWYDDDLADYVTWLREVFPGCRFIINTRDLVDVAASGWWARHDDSLGALRRIEAGILEVGAGLGPDAYRVHYDDFVADPLPCVGSSTGWGRPGTSRRCARRSAYATR